MQHKDRYSLQPLALALQGGGSFGAFTWGVIDALLAAEGTRFAAASGASAGAVNAVLLADGLAAGGPEEARARLARFWRLMSDRAGPTVLARMGALLPQHDLALPPLALDLPGTDVLRDLLRDLVDFDRLRRAGTLRLLLAATRVRDGQARLFREKEVTLDVVLASACLPLLREAVTIDGEAYWDGGYSANPPLRALIRETDAKDVLLVQLAPDERAAPPRLRADIRMRSLELAFSAPLRRELEWIEAMRALCRRPLLLQPRECRRLARVRLHRLSLWDEVDDLSGASPTELSWSFLTRLADAGRRAAREWLERMRSGATVRLGDRLKSRLARSAQDWALPSADT